MKKLLVAFLTVLGLNLSAVADEVFLVDETKELLREIGLEIDYYRICNQFGCARGLKGIPWSKIEDDLLLLGSYDPEDSVYTEELQYSGYILFKNKHALVRILTPKSGERWIYLEENEYSNVILEDRPSRPYQVETDLPWVK